MDPAPLLEREPQLAVLDGALAAATAGTGATVLIRGAPGIGKTRLASELRRHAEASGMTALVARGGELERDFAFGCVRQLFEPVLAADESRRRTLLSGAARLAESVFVPDAVSADPTFGVVYGLYWMTANLAEAAPLVLVLDDAHWADPASLRFAAFLARRLEGVPAVLALTVRRTDAGADPLREIALDPATMVVDLAPLSPGAVADAVAARLGEHAGDRLGAACHRATAGNPFLLGELLRELNRDAPQSPEAIERLAPDRVGTAVLSRLQRAGDAARALARAVAVLGDGVSLSRAAELADLDVDSAGRIADALGDADILDSGRPLRFAHPIVRNAILDGTPGAERERLHRRAATLLATAGAPAEAQAAHLLAVEPAGRAHVVAVLRATAAGAGRRGAPEIALRYLERALAEPPPAAVRADLLAELGFAAGLQGDPRALDWLRGAVDAGRGSAAAVESAAAFCSAVAFAGGADEAFALADRVLRAARAAETPHARLESALLGLAQISPATRRLVREPVRENLRAALAGADLPPALLANAATEHATAGGTADEAAALARRAIERGVVDDVGRDEPGPALTLGALILAERLDEAERLAAELIATARARGTLRYYAAAVALRAWARCRSGRLADVRADADLYPELPKPAVTDVMIAGAHIQALVDVGELDEASAVAERILGEPIDRTLTVYQRFAEGLSLLRIAQDDHRGALDVALGVAEWETGTGQTGGTWVAWRCHAAVAHAALGEHDAALTLAEEQLALARRFGAPGHLGSALRVLGTVGRDVAVLREACEALERSPLLLERARANVDLGRELHRAGLREEAREHLREGLAGAQRCGAAALAARALDALVAAGARPRRPAAAAADALTPSERRVSQLAADGMTNKEIAQALFVTVNTVETHLRRAYRKLGINSRAQLGGRLDPSAGFPSGVKFDA